MGRIYTASFSEQAETIQCDLMKIVAGASDLILIHEIGISQGTELGDIDEEMLLLKWKSGTTGGSGGNTSAIVPYLTGDAATGAVVEDTNTTKATGGVIHFQWYWNVRIPFQQIFTPEIRPVIIPSRHAVLELATTPNDSITYGGYIVFEEIG
jgi:hypothetical protein